MNINTKESNLNSKAVEVNNTPDSKKDLLEPLNFENPRIKGQIEYNGQTASLIKYDKKYEQYKYSVYAILYMGKIYDIEGAGLKNCIIEGITEDGIIISYCNGHGEGNVKWNSMMFNGKNLNKLSYYVDRIETLDNGEKVLICKDNDKAYVLYDGAKSPDFDLIEHVQLFNGKLAIIGRINERLQVSVGDQVYGKGERWDSVKLVGGGHVAPRIEWTTKGETFLD